MTEIECPSCFAKIPSAVVPNPADIAAAAGYLLMLSGWFAASPHLERTPPNVDRLYDLGLCLLTPQLPP